ncbi:hypothetical protein HW555_009151 [Spodoptera exigua]|uniref:Uncharacterized protein n=1 Tax=Spodoptera exigua TaxID=7107 RepID=A0A835GCK5_SPOEX|nr:hypothetical protein HW555_009151 [Spodoptera exigua]
MYRNSSSERIPRLGVMRLDYQTSRITSSDYAHHLVSSTNRSPLFHWREAGDHNGLYSTHYNPEHMPDSHVPETYLKLHQAE